MPPYKGPLATDTNLFVDPNHGFCPEVFNISLYVKKIYCEILITKERSMLKQTRLQLIYV